jgi:hypothetical protein
MIDSMFQEGTDRTLDDQVRRPRPPLPTNGFRFKDVAKAPFQGIGSATAEGIAFGSEITGAFGDVAGIYGESGRGMFATQTQEEKAQAETARRKLMTVGPDYSSDAGDLFRARARDIMPDPQTTHISAQIVAGFSNFAAKAVGYSLTAGPMAPAVLAGDVGLTEADRLKQQGVDLSTRTQAGTVAGGLAGLSIIAPMTGATAGTRFMKGVAIGEGTIAGQAAAEQAILKHAGYDKLASTFDPLDPVSLAMGLVPGVLGAAFGRPIKTTPQIKAAATLTPAEQARSAAFERSPVNLAELEAAIKAEKNPANRAALVAELELQRTKVAEAPMREAVQSNPDAVPAARVQQSATALMRSRLTPDTDLAGADAHVVAVELAFDQIGRGESVNVADLVERAPDLTIARETAVQIDAMQAERATLEPIASRMPEPGSKRIASQPVQQAAQQRMAEIDAAMPVLDQQIAPYRTFQAAEQLRAELSRTEPQTFATRPAEKPSRAQPIIEQAKAAHHELTASGKTLAQFVADKPQRPEVQNLLIGMNKADEAGRAKLLSNFDTAARRDTKTPLQDLAADAVESHGKKAPEITALDRAAQDVASLNPDMQVEFERPDGTVVRMKAGDLLDAIKKEAEGDLLEGRLLEAAAACAMRG